MPAYDFSSRLRGADLRAADLRHLRFDGVDLSRADLRGVNLRGRSLRGANLDGARLDGADLSGADLRDASLAGASLRDVTATGARFDRSTAPDAHAIGLQAGEASFVGAEWPRARLALARFENADLRGVRFDSAGLEQASFVRANLGRAVLDDAALDGADLAHVRGRSLALRAARGRFVLNGADLRGADLREVPLDEMSLAGVDLAGASVDRRVSRRHGTLLRTLGWTPAFELQGTAAVLVRLRALRPLAWLEAIRRKPVEEDAGELPPAPQSPWAQPPVQELEEEGQTPPPEEAEVDNVDLEEAFAQAAFERERERARATAARDSMARRRVLQAVAERVIVDPEMAAGRRRELAELGNVEIPSEIRDAFADIAAARQQSAEYAGVVRDARARSQSRRALVAAVLVQKAAEQTRLAAEREQAAAQVEQAWRQRIEAMRLVQVRAREQALAELGERARREQEVAAAEAAARAAEIAAEDAARRAAEAVRMEAEGAQAEAARLARLRAEAEAQAAAQLAQREREAAAAAALRLEEERSRLLLEAAAAEASAAAERERLERERVEAAVAEAARRSAAAREAAAQLQAARELVEREAAEREAGEEEPRERALAEAREGELLARREQEAAARALETARREESLALAAAHRRAAETQREYAAQLFRATAARAHEARRRSDLEALRQREERTRAESVERQEIVAREAEARRAADQARRLAAERLKLEVEEAARTKALALAEANARAAEQAREAAELRAKVALEGRERREAARRAAAEAGAAEDARRRAEAETRRAEQARRALEIQTLRAAEEEALRAERQAMARVSAAARAATIQRAAEAAAHQVEARALALAAAARLDRLRRLAAGMHSQAAEVTRTERARLAERNEQALAARLEERAETRDEAGALAAAAAARLAGRLLTATGRRARAALRSSLARGTARAEALGRDGRIASRAALRMGVGLWWGVVRPLSAAAARAAPGMRAALDRLEPPPETSDADRLAAEPLEAVKAIGRGVAARLAPVALLTVRLGGLPFRELSRVRLRAAVRGATTRLLAADTDAVLPVAELEEGLDFAYDANERQAAVQAGGAALLTARSRAAREAHADRADGGARLKALSVGRADREDLRGRLAVRAAFRAARRVRHNEAVAPGSATEAARRRLEVSDRRALAEELRRAQFAREAELKRRREEAALRRLAGDLGNARSRLAAAEQAAVVDLAEVTQLRVGVTAREAAIEAQRARVDAVTTAQKQAATSASADRRRRVVRALTAGVGFVRERFGSDNLELLPGADLSRRSLDELDLSGKDLRNARMVGCTLVGADLRGADLRGADLSEADFTGARLEGAQFDGAILDDAVIDQVSVEGASFVGVRALGAQLGGARGLTPEMRSVLVAAGAETPTAGDWRGVSLAAAAVLLTAGIGGAFFVFGRYDAGRLDDGSLEQAAGLARAGGRPLDAVAAFSLLAERATTAQTQADYWLEAATAAEDADDREGALLRLEEAVSAAVDTQEYPRVLIARAQAWNRLSLGSRAETEFRALVSRADLTPDQAAAAIVGLRAAMGSRGAEEVALLQKARLDDAPTDQGRASLAMALADAWAAGNDLDAGRDALRLGLAGVEAEEEVIELQLRLARAEADSGDVSAALAIYTALEAGLGSGEARLGAAGLLERMGRTDEAVEKIKPLLTARDPDIRSRALYAAASAAERSGRDAEALVQVRTLLSLDGVPPAVLDGARILLARLDPSAVDDLVADNPSLAAELLIGRAQALREMGERTDARALYVQVAEGVGELQVRVDARIALAELDVEDGDHEGAVARFDALLAASELGRDTRERVSLARSTALLGGNRIQDAEAGFRALIAGSGPEVQDQCRLGLGRAAELRGQLKAAAELYAIVGRGSGPWAIEALLSMGRMREGAGDLPGAIEAYRLARARPGGEASRRAAAHIALAQALAASGDEAAAAEAYGALLEDADVNVRTQARLAVAEARLPADPLGARALLEAALSDAGPGERSAVRTLWIEAAVRTGEVAQVQARLGAWVETEGDAGARDELVSGTLRVLRSQGHDAAAIDLATRWSSVGFESGMESALTFRELGELDRAQAVLASLDAASLGDRRWHDEVYADVLVEVGDLDAADAVWSRLASSDPGGARFGRGRVARLRGDAAGAILLLADSADARAPEELGQAFEALGRYPEAGAAYALLVASADPERRTAGRVGQARLRVVQDDHSGALMVLAQLTTVDPGYALTVAQIKGDSLLALSRVTEARDVYRVLEGDSEVTAVRGLGLAECALAAGDHAEARRQFFEAFRQSTDRYYKADALSGLVRALMQAGKFDAAADRLAELRKDYPERPDAIARAQAAVSG